MTAEITLTVPKERESCALWLVKQAPDAVADLLDTLDMMVSIVLPPPDVQKMKHEHAMEMERLRAQHEADIASRLDALTDELRSKPAKILEPRLDDMLHYVVRSHYESRRRLPRSVADVLPSLNEEHRAELLDSPATFDAVLAAIKRDHYSVANRRPKGASI